MYIDTHCHLFSPYFNEIEAKKEIDLAFKNQIKSIIIPCVVLDNWTEIEKLIDQFDFVYGAIGVHPSESNIDLINLKNKLSIINVNKIKAIGEIGLDFYHEDNPNYEVQRKIFEFFLDLALKFKKPALIHMRNSEQEIYNILKNPKYKKLKFVIHSFTSTLEWANKFIDLGGYISFSGIVTFKNAKNLQNVAQNIDINKILIETDSPYLTPSPVRGKPNSPSNVLYIAQFLSKLLNNQDVIKTIFENTKKLFKI